MQQYPDPTGEADFATENESAGFKAAYPLLPGAQETEGPLEGFDPDHLSDGYPRTWERVRQAARSAWHRLHR